MDLLESARQHNEKILEIRNIVRERDEYRTKVNYLKSDELRDKLSQIYNVEIIDQKSGPSGWKFKDGSSKKLMNIDLPSTSSQQASSLSKKRSLEDSNNNNSSKTNVNENQVQKKVKEEVKKKSVTTSSNNNNKGNNNITKSAEQIRNSAVLGTVIKTNNNDSHRVVQGVTIEIIKPGQVGSRKSQIGDRIKMKYVGKLKSNNKVFDASAKKPFQFKLGKGEVIKGWDIGCWGMAVGEQRRLTIPPEKAYGKSGSPPTIPSNATLVFDVTLLEIM
eukprot:gene16083-21844_t